MLQVFGDSSDETAYFRFMLNRESTSNCLVRRHDTGLRPCVAAPTTLLLIHSRAISDSFFDRQ
jgi:Vesicle coat complex COPII, subunit SEC23